MGRTVVTRINNRLKERQCFYNLLGNILQRYLTQNNYWQFILWIYLLIYDANTLNIYQICGSEPKKNTLKLHTFLLVTLTAAETYLSYLLQVQLVHIRFLELLYKTL